MGQKKIMFFLLFKNKCKHIEIYIEYRIFFYNIEISFFQIYIYCPALLTNEDYGSNQNQQKSNDMQELWPVSISLTQYT